jgi:hypothetical protein
MAIALAAAALSSLATASQAQAQHRDAEADLRRRVFKVEATIRDWVAKYDAVRAAGDHSFLPQVH